MSSDKSSSNDKKRISFLFGSGISVAVGMPSTKDITQEISSDDGFKLTKRILRNDNKNNKDESEIQLVSFQPCILDYIKKLYMITEAKNIKGGQHFAEIENRRQINYEDIYYMLEQIFDHRIGNYNPFGEMLSELLDFDISMKEPYYAETYYPNDTPRNQFLIDARSYIRYSVERMLKNRNIQSKELKKIDIINDAVKDQKALEIFSLNHDTILEQYMETNRIPFYDGFGEIDGELRIWESLFYGKSKKFNSGIRLLKLHGSINWDVFEEIGSGERILAIRTGKQDLVDGSSAIFYLKSKDKKYKFIASADCLVGTDNKTEYYLFGKYSKLQNLFREQLMKTDILIVSGYSFGDTVINSRIIEWLIDRESNGIILIDNKEEDCFFKQAKFAIRENYLQEWKENRKIIYLGCGIEGISWKGIKEYFKYLIAVNKS